VDLFHRAPSQRTLLNNRDLNTPCKQATNLSFELRGVRRELAGATKRGALSAHVLPGGFVVLVGSRGGTSSKRSEHAVACPA
jgi:hypothetical protein